MDLNALPQQAAANLLSVTPRSLRDWEKAGEGIPRNANGTYPGPALVAWYVTRQLGEELDPSQERARRDKESADKLALENAKTRGELCNADEVSDWYRGHIDRANARFLNIPDVLGQFCDPRTALIVVPESRRLIHEAIAELAADSAKGGSKDIVSVDVSAHVNGERVGGSEAKAIERKQRRTRPMEN